MKPIIDNLIFIHEKIADGATQQRFKTFDVFAYERLGGAHLLVGLNNNGINAHTITVDTGFGAEREAARLHRSLRRRPDRRQWAGHDHDPEKHERARVRLLFARGDRRTLRGRGARRDAGLRGGQDLDIKPADNTAFVQVCRVFVAAGRPIKGALAASTPPSGRTRRPSRSNWTTRAGPSSRPATSSRTRRRASQSRPRPARPASTPSGFARPTRRPRTPSRPTSSR